MRMKRSTGLRRIASSSTCVPSTFVVTNSEPPCSIDFSTCDSAAAFTITLAVNREQRPALDPALNPAEILADQRQDETLDSEHVEHRHPTEERPREVRVVDPEHDPPGGERGREQCADRPERDPGPLDRL